MKESIGRTLAQVSRAAGALERRLGTLLQHTTAPLVPGAGRQREPLEVVHAVVDATCARVLPTGRGTSGFPFNAVRLQVVCPDAAWRARFAALVGGTPNLRDRIAHRLAGAGCSVPDLTVHVTYPTRAKPGWEAPEFHLVVDRAEPSSLPGARDPMLVEILVTRGETDAERCVLSQRRINLGRCAEVQDARGRPLRTNHVAFSDVDDEVNHTVSRQHAHLSISNGHVRVHDDGSSHGTYLVRQGDTILVPRGARGVRLQSGDEVRLGEARLVVTFVQP